MTTGEVEQAEKFIVEYNVCGPQGCETIDSLREYLRGDPHPRYRLVNIGKGLRGYVLTWERSQHFDN